MLHEQAGAGNARPAAGAHEDRLAAGFDQLYQVGVEADGGHGQDDEEFGQLFKGLEHVGANAGHGGHGGDNGRQDEEQDKEGENLFQLEGAV